MLKSVLTYALGCCCLYLEFVLRERNVRPARVIPVRPNSNAIIDPAFPLPDPNTAPEVTIKCTIQKTTANKPSVRAILVPFNEERFLARTAKTILHIAKANSTSPKARAVVMPLI